LNAGLLIFYFCGVRLRQRPIRVIKIRNFQRDKNENNAFKKQRSKMQTRYARVNFYFASKNFIFSSYKIPLLFRPSYVRSRRMVATALTPKNANSNTTSATGSHSRIPSPFPIINVLFLRSVAIATLAGRVESAANTPRSRQTPSLVSKSISM
jgi:hypothetical protein